MKREEEIDLIEQQLFDFQEKEREAKELLQLFKEGEAIWQQEKPNILSTIIHFKSFEDWSEKLSHYRKEQMGVN